MITRQITLAPGKSIDVPIYSRPWGMCADGSCSKSSMVLDGDFSDLTFVPILDLVGEPVPSYNPEGHRRRVFREPASRPRGSRPNGT